MNKTAIVYHYMASYREPVFIELMKSKKVEFTLYSGLESEIKINKIDPKLAKTPIEEGGLRWLFLKNRFIIKKKFLWQSGLFDLAINSSYDSIIFLGSPYFVSTWFAAFIARLKGKKVFYWMHGVYKNKLNFMDFIKLFLFYKIANGFFLYGKRSYNVLNKFKIKSQENIHIIYNSLDYRKSLEFRKPLMENDIYMYRNKYFNDSSIPVIVFIGRLNHVKRLDMLLASQIELKNAHNKSLFNVLIIGDGDEKIKLKHFVEENHLEDNVLFLGAIYDEKIISHALMYADVCVTPGEVGLTAIHSLSYGTPVISHDNFDLQMPEVESIKCGVTGDLYKYNNQNDLTNVIEKWLLKNPIKTQSSVNDCYEIIDKYYNPIYQLKVFETVLIKN